MPRQAKAASTGTAKTTRPAPRTPRRTGRPSQGYDASISAHVSAEAKAWLVTTARETGLREGELVRSLLDYARRRGWRPQ